MRWIPLLDGLFVAAVLAAASTTGAYQVTSFDPNAFFTTGIAPAPAEVDALDAAAGLGGFVIEDFEDLALESDLTVEFSGGAPVSVVPPGSLVIEPGAAWDGSLALSALIDLVPDQPLVIRHASGVDVIAVGLSGIDHSHELVVNGVNLGAVDDLPGYQATPFDNGRSLYVRVQRDPGDPLITELAIEPDPVLANPNGDFIRIDHLATGFVLPVPTVSKPMVLVLLGLLGVVAGRGLRRASISAARA